MDFEFAKRWAGVCERLLGEGRVKAHPVRVEREGEREKGKGGLEGVLEGLERLRRGEVSGEKLVYLVK